MEKYKINIIYGKDSLEELIINSIVKDISTIINNESNSCCDG